MPNESNIGATPPGWGFAEIRALTDQKGDAAVLNGLAYLVEEWKNKHPDSPVALSRRLVEFREGCSLLLLDEQLPLSPSERDWLRMRCRDWASAFDENLRLLEESGDVTAVRTAVDRTANEMATELRERAKSVNS